jgi:hypothetical protein
MTTRTLPAAGEHSRRPDLISRLAGRLSQLAADVPRASKKCASPTHCFKNSIKTKEEEL